MAPYGPLECRLCLWSNVKRFPKARRLYSLICFPGLLCYPIALSQRHVIQHLIYSMLEAASCYKVYTTFANKTWNMKKLFSSEKNYKVSCKGEQRLKFGFQARPLIEECYCSGVKKKNLLISQVRDIFPFLWFYIKFISKESFSPSVWKVWSLQKALS